MLTKITGEFKAMPNWQKAVTVIGVLTVGFTITMTTTALVKKSIGLIKGKDNAIDTDASDAKIIDATEQLKPEPKPELPSPDKKAS